uniref:Cathelicidin-AL n=1 Tax=Amolops loloensis TaxID=318551 RepID=I1T028_AMOLO|nr:cathelicidin-AL [Amolops loloensis]
MGLSATLWFLMGVAAGSMASPLLQWSEDDISVMALYSTDYYNKVSGEDVLYGLQENNTEYITDEKSRFHQLSFPIQKTVCQKSDNALTDDCAFKEGGVVKSCTSYFFEEDDRDIIVVTCQSQDGHREHSRVRRSRRGRGGGRRGGSGGRGGRGGGGRSGAGSSIAGVGSRGGGGGRHYA